MMHCGRISVSVLLASLIEGSDLAGRLRARALTRPTWLHSSDRCALDQPPSVFRFHQIEEGIQTPLAVDGITSHPSLVHNRAVKDNHVLEA